MAKPTVVVVGADKGGVGKTTVARTLLDYFTAHHVPTRAFDTESPKGTLKRFHPDITEIVDVTSVADQMRIFDTLSRRGERHRDRRARRAALADAALAARHRLPRRGEKGAAHLRGLPYPRLVDRLPQRDRGDLRLHDRRQVFPGQELHQQHELLRVGPGHPRLVFPQVQGRHRDHHPEAQRDGVRAGRARFGAVPHLRRQQAGERRCRQLFVRVARLCPALARQCLGRVRPYQAQRDRGDRRRRACGNRASRSPAARKTPRLWPCGRRLSTSSLRRARAQARLCWRGC